MFTFVMYNINLQCRQFVKKETKINQHPPGWCSYCLIQGQLEFFNLRREYFAKLLKMQWGRFHFTICAICTEITTKLNTVY